MLLTAVLWVVIGFSIAARIPAKRPGKRGNGHKRTCTCNECFPLPPGDKPGKE